MPTHGPPLATPIDLNRLLKAGLGRDPAAAALQDLTHAITWAELDRQVEQLARAYRRLGLQQGDRLASLIPNRVELVVHYLAGLRSGLVLTPLNYRYVPPEIDHALTVSGAAALVFHGERLADVQASAVAPRLPLGCHRLDDPTGLGVCGKTQTPSAFFPGKNWFLVDFSSQRISKGWMRPVCAVFEAFGRVIGHTTGQPAVHAASIAAGRSRLPMRIRL
ncbi:AMP-binding protein [Cyanobium sp. ULC084]